MAVVEARSRQTRIFAVTLATLLVGAGANPESALGQELISFGTVAELRPKEVVAEVGEVEGDEGVAFTAVFDARFVGDSTIAVTDARRPLVLLLNLTSGAAGAIGGAGEGPGEFSGTPYIGRVGAGRLQVWDAGSGRLSSFELDGELAEEVTLDPTQMSTLPRSSTPRAWQVEDGLVLSATGRQRRDGDQFVTTIRPMVVNPGDGSVTSVGSTMSARLPTDGGIFVQSPWVPFGVMALHNAKVVVADSAEWELKIHDVGSGPPRTIRSDVEARRLDNDRVRQVSATFEGYYGRNRTMMQLFEDIEPPEHLPAIGDLRSHSDGGLLVSRFRPLDTGAPLVVDVLDSDLQPSARLILPEEYSRVLDMSGDRVLVLTRGAFDVPVLRVLRVGSGSPQN